jgi:hypothetical protein
MAYRKAFNPYWVGGELVIFYSQTEMGIKILGDILQKVPLLSRPLSVVVVIFELLPSFLLIKKMSKAISYVMILFHLLLAYSFSIYEISAAFISFYILIVLPHNKDD